MKNADADLGAVEVDDALLRAWPLPQPDGEGGKEERGRALVIAGSREIPGALTLAAIATLHAGAGKLAVATMSSVAQGVAITLPEARVVALKETSTGAIALDGLAKIEEMMERADAMLIGPGMQNGAELSKLVAAAVSSSKVPCVLDAAALDVVRGPTPYIAQFDAPVILTPHAGELAHLSGVDKEQIQARPAEAAQRAGRRWNAVVVLKGAVTYIATPSGSLWRHSRGNIGLGTSGSGDCLAGLMVGLCARGASLEQAAVWAVALHARAGERIASRSGPLGYLARDLSAEVPALMSSLAPDG